MKKWIRCALVSALAPTAALAQATQPPGVRPNTDVQFKSVTTPGAVTAGTLAGDGSAGVSVTAAGASQGQTLGAWIASIIYGTPTVATLRAFPTLLIANGGVAYTSGYYAAGDGGGGHFVWSATSSAADNGGTVVQPTGLIGSGRWLRIIPDRVLTPLMFGARGDGSADDTQAVQNAANAVPSCAQGGGTLFFPSGGSYLLRPRTVNLGVGVILNSCTRAKGDGASSRIVIDYNAPAFGNVTRDMTPTALNAFGTPTVGNQVDHDITVEGLNFDLTTLPRWSSGGQGPPVAASFLLAYNVSFRDNVVTAGTTYPGTGVQFIGVDNARASNNAVVNAFVGVDSWKGSTRVWITNNAIQMAPNPAAGANRECINFNGRGTPPSNNEIARDFHILSNSCRMNGYAQAINIETLGASSQVNDGEIAGNVIDCSAATIPGDFFFLARGLVNRVSVSNNKVIGCSAATNGPQTIVGSRFGTSISTTNAITSTSGSSLFTIALPNHYTGVGSYLTVFSGASPVGGVTLNGYYKITSVVDANTLVVQGPSAATSSATGGGTVNMAAFWGLPYGITFTGNTFVNSSSGTTPLLVLNMGASIVKDNVQLGSGTFGTFILVDNSDPTQSVISPLVKDNLSQQAGTVLSGSTLTYNSINYAVSGNVAYNSFIQLLGSGPSELNFNNSGLDFAIATKTAAYALTPTDNWINADATSGAVAISLPVCTSITKGREYTVKKVDSSANAVTVPPSGSNTIDGANTATTLSAAQAKVTLRCGGTGAWWTR